MSRSALISERVISFQPSLAKLVGLPEAVAIQQLKFALSAPRSGRNVDGHKWIWNTYEDWQRDFFPFWSISTIQRSFLNLERRGLIISCQPDGHASRRKYYRLNEGMMAKLTIEAAESLILNDNPDHVKLTCSNASKCRHAIRTDIHICSDTRKLFVTGTNSGGGLTTGFIPRSGKDNGKV